MTTIGITTPFIDNELIVLDSIYGNDLEVKNQTPLEISIHLSATDFFQGENYSASLSFCVRIPTEYPVEMVTYSIIDTSNINEEILTDYTQKILTKLKSIIGMPMIFEIGILLQDCVNQSLDMYIEELKNSSITFITNTQGDTNPSITQIETPFSPEEFIIWARQFEKEMEPTTIDPVELKITGRSFFENIKSSKQPYHEENESEEDLENSD